MIDPGPLLLQCRPLPTTSCRVGLVAEDPAAAWVVDLIELLGKLPSVQVSVYSHTRKSGLPEPPTLTNRLYEASRQRFDPFTPRAIDNTATGPIRADLDIAIWLAPVGDLPVDCSALARFGVLTIQFGDERAWPPFSGEMLEEVVVSRAVLHWHATSRDQSRAIRTAETSTVGGWFLTRNAEEPLVAVSRMIAGVVLDIAADGNTWQQRMTSVPETQRPVSEAKHPSNFESATYVAKQASRSIRLRLQARGRRFSWLTAIRQRSETFYRNTGRFLPDGWQEVPIPAGSEMADPFLFEKDGKAWLFYEEVPAGSSKGRLSCLEILDSGGFGKPHVILEKDYHLSYPCVFEHNGEIFMLPETSAGGSVQLYRATRFPFAFEPAAILVDGVALVDTTPFLHDGVWYFFTTTPQPFMETFLFWSDKLDGRWRMHPSSPISSSVTSSRAAGQMFYTGNRLLRPTQDCSVRYGYGMTINEVTRLTPSEFEERRVDFIGPDWQPGLLGTHTLNASRHFEVIDGLRYAQ